MPPRDDDDSTHQTSLPAPSPDEQATGALADVGIVAELRATLSNGEKKTLPLYTLADQIVVGRGTACEWQLDDASLSRKHAQLKWSGRELTVEDMGSANGTRVGGRPARTAIPARPGEPIQLGTVVVTLELRQNAADPDGVSTRLVETPESRADARFPQRPGLATVVQTPRVVDPRGADRAQARAMPTGAQVFHPSRDAARPDEPTRPWDPRAAMVHAADKAFDGELTERLKDAWKTNRRPFVLAGAALWIGVLLTVWYIHDRVQPEEEEQVAAPRVNAPKVTALTPEVGPADLGTAPLATEERDDQLAQAVAAYEQGRMPEALALFRRLATDPRDTTARFMVELIQSRLAQGTP